jgi:hypothetical protein
MHLHVGRHATLWLAAALAGCGARASLGCDDVGARVGPVDARANPTDAPTGADAADVRDAIIITRASRKLAGASKFLT